MSEDDKIQILKDILFEEDSVYIERMSDRLEQLEETFNNKQKFSARVDPMITLQLKEFERSIPTTMGPAITAALKSEIKRSQDTVVDVLFPIMGKMIKKYVAQEVGKLSDKINQQFSFGGKTKSWFGKSKAKKAAVDKLVAAQIEQVLLIEKESGLLKGSYSRNQMIDEEMISGMLTAIKNFVEDAFVQKNQDLELIDYEMYHIHIQNFKNYYVAVVLSGNYTLPVKDKVQDLIFDFYEEFTQKDDYRSLGAESIKQHLAENFEHADL